MHATRDRCCSAIFDVIIMIGSFWQRQRPAGSKKGFDHVGENGACLGEVECRYGRIHSVEVLAAAEELGVDRTDLVERLAHVAVVVEVLGDFDESVVRHVIYLRTLVGRADRQVALGAVAAVVGAVAARVRAAAGRAGASRAACAAPRWTCSSFTDPFINWSVTSRSVRIMRQDLFEPRLRDSTISASSTRPKASIMSDCPGMLA